MIDRLNPYPAMKDSGVEWLEMVPDHWAIVPLKRIGSFASGSGFPIVAQGDAGSEIPFVKVSDMNSPGNERTINGSANTVSRDTAKDLGARVFDEGAIVFPKVGGALLTNKRRVLGRPSCIDNNVMACLVKNADGDYAFCMLKWLDLARFVQPGPVPAIGEGEVRELRIALPPLPEQSALARFLDHADTRIQRYIRAKENLIALLEEQKQAIIHQVVTGQTDVRMGERYPAYRDSGVEWLGEVPEHWDVRRLGQIGTFSKGSGGNKDDEVPEGVPCIRYGDLYTTHKYFIRSSRSCVPDSRAADYTLIRFGDLLFAGSGETMGEIGKSAVNLVRSEVRCGGDIIVFRANHEVEPEFLGYATDAPSAAAQKATMGRGFTVMHIYAKQLKRLAVALPPLAEQAEIARFLNDALTRIDAGMVAAARQIRLVQELRSSLTANVVTGKLDVREAASTLLGRHLTQDATSVHADP